MINESVFERFFRLIILLKTIEDKVKEKAKQDKVKKEYEKIEKETAPIKESAPSPTLRSRIGSAYKNIKNVANNAIDNTAGYVIAKGQNYGTRRHYKKKTDSKEDIVYLMHGLFQNEGSQWRLAKELKKQGKRAYHLKGKHHLSRKDNAEQTFGQIDKFHKKTKLEDAYDRSDYFSGHSSGGDLGIYMAGDKRIRKYGIKTVQARAPAPYGLKKAETLGQKLLLPFAGKDDVSKYIGKREAAEMHKRKPKVDVHVIAGKQDRLSLPKVAVYKHAKSHKVIDHPHSTHFGTSGGNKYMNQLFVDEINKYKKKPKDQMYAYEKAA